MPTIRVTTPHGECLYDADRVVRDSQCFVVEGRRDGVWVQCGSFPAADVLGVDRFVPGDDVWLREDVRVGAGLCPGHLAASGAADRRRSPWWRRRPTAVR